MNLPPPAVDKVASKNAQAPYCSHRGATRLSRADAHRTPGAPPPSKRAIAAQTTAVKATPGPRLAKVSDPLGARPKTCFRIETAWSQVSEWKKIWVKLIKANVKTLPAPVAVARKNLPPRGSDARSAAGRAFCRARSAMS